MNNLDIINLYERTEEKEANSFLDNVESKVRVKTDYEKLIRDTEWIDVFMQTIPYLDNIFRNPNRFIINEEEIVKIELARRITVDSIKHLARNTNLIQSIDNKTGEVKPSKILNINKEESYDTYENKVIFTLIQNMKIFIMRKKKVIEENQKQGNKNNKLLEYEGISKLSGEKVNLNFTLHTELNNHGAKNNEGQKVLERIEELEFRVRELTNTEVYKFIEKKHIALITPPIKKTNLILKNVNFQYAMRLWNYIQDNMDDKTKNIKEKKDYEEKGELKKLIEESFLLQYLAISILDKDKKKKKEKEIKDKLVNDMIEKIVLLNGNLNEKQIKGLIADKYAIIKNRNLVTTQEIQKIFKKNIDKYLKKVNQE